MIVGIDPGVDGAIAIYNADLGIVRTIRFPTFHLKVNKAKRRILDVQATRTILAGIKELYPLAVVALENPHSMPKQGVASSFSFGRSVGVLEGLIVGISFTYRLIEPAVWKRAMKLSPDKDYSRRRASQLFPEHADQWAKPADEGRAEAALLAYYYVHGGTK